MIWRRLMFWISVLGAGSVAMAPKALAQATATQWPTDMPLAASMHADDNSPDRLDAQCVAIPAGQNGRARIRCEFNQVYLTIPTSAQVASAVTKAQDEMRAGWAAATAADWQKVCAMGAFSDADGGVPPDAAVLAKAAKEACSTHSAEPLIKEAGRRAQEESSACRVNTHAFTEMLERFGPGDWRGWDGPRGVCDLTLATALSRGNNGLWYFRQVRTPPARPIAGCEHLSTTQTSSFGHGSADTWPIACVKIRL